MLQDQRPSFFVPSWLFYCLHSTVWSRHHSKYSVGLTKLRPKKARPSTSPPLSVFVDGKSWRNLSTKQVLILLETETFFLFEHFEKLQKPCEVCSWVKLYTYSHSQQGLGCRGGGGNGPSWPAWLSYIIWCIVVLGCNVATPQLQLQSAALRFLSLKTEYLLLLENPLI